MTPILYSFRRCPYAIRARLALRSADVRVELREILLRDKPVAFLAASPSATVPCLVTQEGAIDESLDIMQWALGQSDPEQLMQMPALGWDLIAYNDGPFKQALDRCKYASRYPDEDPTTHRAAAMDYLHALEGHLDTWLFARPSLADIAILPFVRQFAFIDKAWFDAQDLPKLQEWLGRFLNCAPFAHVMQKNTVWTPDASTQFFP